MNLKFTPPRLTFRTAVTAIVLWLVYSGCIKTDRLLPAPQLPAVAGNNPNDIRQVLESNFFVQNRRIADLPGQRTSIAEVETHMAGPSEYPDEVPMVLGAQLPNP